MNESGFNNYMIEDKENVVLTNNEYDYSNVIPNEEGILFLVDYMYKTYEYFLELIKQDEQKNEQYKREFKNYMFKKHYATDFNIVIREKGYNNITCKDYLTFAAAVKDGNLRNIESMDIKMNLSYKRGSESDLQEHENEFSIIIRPFNIVFARKSNRDEDDMKNVEQNIKNIFMQMPAMNSIFCTK